MDPILRKLLNSVDAKSAERLRALIDDGMSIEAAADKMGVGDVLKQAQESLGKVANAASAVAKPASDLISNLLDKGDLDSLKGQTNKDLIERSNKSGSPLKSAANIASAAISGSTAGPIGAVGAAGLTAINEILGNNKEKKEAKEAEDELTRRSIKAESIGSKIGTGVGAAQMLAGIAQGQSIDIPEFEASTDIKKASDMLLEAYEQGIDPNILATGRRDIEARRRSQLYQNQESPGSAGANYNKDVVANLLANKAGTDLTIATSREKDAKLGPAANALIASDEMKFKKKIYEREGAYREADAAAGMIGAGIDNIVGSLMLGEQFKAENERKKYES